MYITIKIMGVGRWGHRGDIFQATTIMIEAVSWLSATTRASCQAWWEISADGTTDGGSCRTATCCGSVYVNSGEPSQQCTLERSGQPDCVGFFRQ